MFSSKELISYVFVNENDIYYGDDLLKLNLEQYLWEQLHGSYEAVYFLSASDSTFHVRSFGDLCCNAYEAGKKKLKLFGKNSEQTEQGNWILRQLCAKSGETAAFVCPLEDFCGVLSDSRWEPVLEKIAEEKKRTGIFVLTASATAERTKDLLLDSPVFEKLHETAVTDLRGGALRELYGTLKRRKWDNCLFLNTFSWERIRALLLHLAMEYPERCESCQQLDCLADYLTVYLRDPERQQKEPLLKSDLPTGYLMYRELYEQLSAERVWKKLVEQSTCYTNSAQVHGNPERREPSGVDVPVLRDRNCYAGKCMKVKLPKWVRSHEQEGPRIEKLLQNIRSAVSAPKNRTENSRIIEAADGFLSQIDTVHNGDIDTYKQLLIAVEFCVRWIYTEPESEQLGRVLDVIDKQKNLITFSDQCFGQKRDLEFFRQQATMGVLQRKTLENKEAEARAGEQMRKNYADMVSALILELTMPSASGDIMQKLTELEQDIKKCEEQPPEEEILPPPEEEEESEKDEEFFLRPEDFSYIPPKF